MSDTNAIFNSLWDIDQLIVPFTSVAVTTGDNSVYTITGSIALPTYESQFQPTGSTKWYSEGMYSKDNTLANRVTFYTYISGSTIHAVVPSAGTVRTVLWEDKINNV